jgi:hypothetical protein
LTDGAGEPVPPQTPASAPVPAPAAADAPAQPALTGPIVAERVGFGAALGVVIAAAVVGGWLFPYYRDDRALDRIVRIVAMDWRDFGEIAARARLVYELDHAGIGPWVRDEDCGLSGGVEIEREVRCAWSVDARVPGTDLGLPLSFESRVALAADGSLTP